MEALEEQNSITVINYVPAEQIPGAKGFWETGKLVQKVATIDTAQLSKNLRQMCLQIGNMLDGVTTSIAGYELDTFEAALELSASGEIRFIGSAGVEIKGGLKLVFKHR